MQSKIGPKRIVLVDDDAETLRLGGAMGNGMEIVATAHPNRALAWVKADPAIAMLIVEQHLRVMPGIQVLQEARQHRQDVYRAMTTSFKTLTEIVNGLHTGLIQRLVPRPIALKDIQNLVEMLRRDAA